MNEPFQSETTTFECWKNLATGKYQWIVVGTGDAHGPVHNSEEEAQKWFNLQKVLAQNEWNEAFNRR